MPFFSGIKELTMILLERKRIFLYAFSIKINACNFFLFYFPAFTIFNSNLNLMQHLVILKRVYNKKNVTKSFPSKRG